MASVTMLPAHPPLPTARNLPFQFCAGIHNSIAMCESADGASVATTRQNSGSCLNDAFWRAAPGTENAPAATDCADVIFTPGNAREVRLSQLAAAAGAAPATAALSGANVANAESDRATLARAPAVRRRVVD